MFGKKLLAPALDHSFVFNYMIEWDSQQFLEMGNFFHMNLTSHFVALPVNKL